MNRCTFVSCIYLLFLIITVGNATDQGYVGDTIDWTKKTLGGTKDWIVGGCDKSVNYVTETAKEDAAAVRKCAGDALHDVKNKIDPEPTMYEKVTEPIKDGFNHLKNKNDPEPTMYEKVTDPIKGAYNAVKEKIYPEPTMYERLTEPIMEAFNAVKTKAFGT